MEGDNKMIIAGVYSFNGGQEAVENNYPDLFQEVKTVISNIDCSLLKTKASKEKTMLGQMLYSPTDLNLEFKKNFYQYGWLKQKQPCCYPTEYYTENYKCKCDKATKNAFREMDFVKDKLGVEVQFGKYSFMVYNVCAKMTIFKKLRVIDTGIEIVPIKQFADEMSTGVSYFEQFVWDLKNRGVSNIDVPVLILGIDED